MKKEKSLGYVMAQASFVVDNMWENHQRLGLLWSLVWGLVLEGIPTSSSSKISEILLILSIWYGGLFATVSMRRWIANSSSVSGDSKKDLMFTSRPSAMEYRALSDGLFSPRSICPM